jgi:hypothetical protein
MPLITSNSLCGDKVFVWLGFRSEPLFDLHVVSISIAVRKSIDAPGYGVGHSPARSAIIRHVSVPVSPLAMDHPSQRIAEGSSDDER